MISAFARRHFVDQNSDQQSRRRISINPGKMCLLDLPFNFLNRIAKHSPVAHMALWYYALKPYAHPTEVRFSPWVQAIVSDDSCRLDLLLAEYLDG